MVFHDLTEGRICPPDCKTLFGLGSKFVIQPEWTTSNSDINLSFDRFDRDIQVKSFFADMGEDDDMGSSKLYVKSKWIPPWFIQQGVLSTIKNLPRDNRSSLQLEEGEYKLKPPPTMPTFEFQARAEHHYREYG